MDVWDGGTEGERITLDEGSWMIPLGLRGMRSWCCALAAVGMILVPVAAWGAVATLPFFDDFDYPVLGPWWTTSGTAANPYPMTGSWWYRLLSTCGPPSGTYHMVLDSSVVGTSNRNEVTLTVDLAGKSNVHLAFFAKSFADSPNPLTPWAPYTGSKNFDGVVISPDGVTWYPLMNLTESDGLTRSYTQFNLSLDAALVTWGISYSSSFQIRFNHYGDGQVVSSSGNSGLGIDAVSVYEASPLNCDFGDAPAPYPTLLADNGARHAAIGPMLGATRDVTADGQPSADASGDGADEDGVVFVSPLIPGQAASVRVFASTAAKLDGWIDFNENGSWADAGEQVFNSLPLATGNNDLAVNVPAGAVVSDRMFARFRLSTAGGLSWLGAAADGEVEDYRISIVPDAPVMNAEPTLSPGTSNTVSWSGVAQADSYYVECSQAADFSAIFQASGWIPSTSQHFVGLWDIAQYYRVRAARSLPGDEASWSQTDDAEFASDARSGTALYGDGKVALQGPVVTTNTVGGAREDLKGVAANTGRFNVFKPTQAVRLTGFSMFLSRDSAMNVEFAVYEGESNFDFTGWTNAKVYSKIEAVDAGIGFLSVAGLSMALTPGKYYALGLSWSGTATSYKDTLSTASVSFGSHTGRVQSTACPGETSLSAAYPNVGASGYCYYMQVTTASAAPYLPAGDLVSPVIAPASWIGWRTLNYGASTPAGTAVSVDILPESGSMPIAGWSGLAPGADLRLLTVTPVRLRAHLTTTNTAVSPALLDWGVTWQAEADRRVESSWSAPVMSTQDGQAPYVASVTPDGPNPARTATVRFLVRYSEAVTGVRLASPFSDFALRPGSMPGATILSVTPVAGDASRYEVEVDTGNTGGTVAIDALTVGNIQDLPGNALSAGNATGEAYRLDYTAPTVTSVTLLDAALTNAPTVRFGVTFSEPVTGVPTTAPFTGFSATGISGTSVLSVTGTGADYTVTVKSGTVDGPLGLAVNIGGAVQDGAGWPLAAGMVSATDYALSHLRFTAVPPALTVVDMGNPCGFSVEVSGGTGARSFQWYIEDGAKAWSALSDEVYPALDIAHAGNRDAGLYYCEVTDAHETIESPQARLQVQSYLPVAGGAGLVAVAVVVALAGVWGAGRGRERQSSEPRHFHHS